MSLQERLVQCKKVKEAIEVQEKELLEKIQKEKMETCFENVYLGDVFKVLDSLMMVSCIGYSQLGLTCVDNFAGCYDSSILNGVVDNLSKIRTVLIEKNAKYLGTFNDLFIRKEK